MRVTYTLVSFFSAFFFACTVLVAAPLATFNYKFFYIPSQGAMIETYLDISGSSLALEANDAGSLTGKVEITLVFYQGEEVVSYEKKVLHSPEMLPNQLVDFLDVQRFTLPSGTYQLEITLKDLNDPEGDAVVSNLEVQVPRIPSTTFVSDIELVSALRPTTDHNHLSKSGYDILPMVSDDRLPVDMNELILYAEVYHKDGGRTGEPFVVQVYLEDTLSGELIPSTVKTLRKEAQQVNPLLVRLPLAGVDGGMYTLVVEVRSRENEVVAKSELPLYRPHRSPSANVQTFTEREVNASWVSKYQDKYVLYEHFKSLRPIATETELEAMDHTLSEVELIKHPYLQQYFLAFWEARAPGASEAAWHRYLQQVELAQEKFGTMNKKGYETDRGRVFLRYGSPDDITNRANEPSSYPYQIWRYYKADRWNNVKFVFYDPSLLNVDYELLHCEYIPGEIRNPQWRVLLEIRNTPLNNIDRTEGRDHYGGRLDDFYTNPR